MSRKPPPTTTLGNILRSGLDDIHAKLIDEAWFGRSRPERQQAYADMRSLYGRDPEMPEGWGRVDWTDRLEVKSPGHDIGKDHDIER